MNTKGIKFLAVLAVLAMAFAAIAVVANVEENDAASVTSDATYEAEGVMASGATATTAKNYYVDLSGGAFTLTLPNTIGANVGEVYNLYLYGGDSTKKLTLKGAGAATTNDATINVYVATAAISGTTITYDSAKYFTFVNNHASDDAGTTVVVGIAGENAALYIEAAPAAPLSTTTAYMYAAASHYDAVMPGNVTITATQSEAAKGLYIPAKAVGTYTVSKDTNAVILESKNTTAGNISAFFADSKLKITSAAWEGTVTASAGSVDSTATLAAATVNAFSSAVNTGAATLFPTGYAGEAATYAYGNVSGTVSQAYAGTFTLVKVTGTITVNQTTGADSRTITVNATKASAIFATGGDAIVDTTAAQQLDVKSGKFITKAASFPVLDAVASVNIMPSAELCLGVDTTVSQKEVLNIYGKITCVGDAPLDFAVDGDPIGVINFGSTVNDVRATPLADTAKIGTAIYGGAKSAGGIYNSDSSIEGSILSSDIEITNGATVTITGEVGLNNHSIIITKGKLVVGSTGMVFAGNAAAENVIVIASKDSSFENSGVVGANKAVKITQGTKGAGQYATQAGIAGVQYKYTTDGMGISGTATASSEAWAPAKPTLTLVGTDANRLYITADLTIGTGVAFNPVYVNINAGKNVTLNGDLEAAANALFMNNNTTLKVNGRFVGTVTAYVLDGFAADVSEKDLKAKYSTTTVAGAETAVKLQTVTGFTLSVARTSYSNLDGDMFYNQRAYVDGKLTSTTAKEGTEASTTPTETFTIEGANTAPDTSGSSIYVAQDKELAITTGKLIGGNVFVEGEIVALPNYATSTVFGTTYTIKIDALTTVYVSNFDDAVSMIDYADNKTITVTAGTEVELDSDITVLAGQKIVATGALITIPEEFTLTVMKDATISGPGIVKINGIVYVEYGGSCVPEEGTYDVVATDADKNKLYSGLQKALDSAEGEVTITLSTDKISDLDKLKTLSIKAGITLNVAANLKITKTLSIAEGAKMVVTDSGSLILGDGDEKSRKLTVDGELDLSAVTTSSISGKAADDKIVVNVTGVLKYNKNVTFTNAEINAVSCTISGVSTYTTVEKAVAGKATSMTVVGKYSDTSLEMIAPTTLTIAADAEMTVKSIDASAGATITVNGTLSTTVTGVSGTDKDATAITLSGFTGKIAQTSKTISTGETEYTFAITQMDEAGSISIDSGSVSLACSPTVAASKKLVIADMAELVISGDSGITNKGTVTVAGLLTVAEGGDLTINNDNAKATLAINGIVAVEKGGEFAFNTATVNGSILVDGKLTINGATTVNGAIAIDESDASEADVRIAGAVTLGASTLGDAAMIVGPFSLTTNTAFIKAFPGTIIDADSIKGYVATEIYLNNVLYCTAIAKDTNTVKIYAADGVITAVVKVEGFNMNGMSTATNWKDEDGNYLVGADFPVIGVNTKLSFDGVAGTATVKVSTVKGVSIFVDGINYASGSEVQGLKVGTHTVKATIDPGYKGTTAITFNGKSVTSSFEITAEMAAAGADMGVLSVTGDITIDPGVSPEPTPAEKEAFGITEILLVVLVILIAVMVIIVLLRMNRS